MHTGLPTWSGFKTGIHEDELDARCGSSGAFAQTQWGAFADEWTRLFLPFFYSQ